MSLNIPFAGRIVDENEVIVPFSYVQALYIGDDGTKLWDSEIRQTDSNGIYNLNLGDDTFATVSNFVKTNGSNGKLLLNAWSDDKVRGNVHSKMGSTYVRLDDSSVYVNDIQILPVAPLECGNWTIDTQYFINDIVHCTSSNTNERTYVYNNRNHYQYRVLEEEIVFDSLGAKQVEWDFGEGFTSSPNYVFNSAGFKNVTHRVSDLYTEGFVSCSREIQVFARVSGNLSYYPVNPKVGETVTVTPSVMFDYQYITNIKYIINGVVEYSGMDYSSEFTYVPSKLGNDTITVMITYNNGFESKYWQLTYTVEKTNTPPTMNLVVIEPVADSRYTFIHNGKDFDGYVAEVNYIIERNSKDLYNKDNWTSFYETGRTSDLSDFTYDFAQESGEFRVTVVVYDDYGDSVSDSYTFTKVCGIGVFDLTLCDWSKRVVVNKFSINKHRASFASVRIHHRWEMKPTRIEWDVNRTVMNWDVARNQISFKLR